jgi:hypothetical protein
MPMDVCVIYMAERVDFLCAAKNEDGKEHRFGGYLDLIAETRTASSMHFWRRSQTRNAHFNAHPGQWQNRIA